MEFVINGKYPVKDFYDDVDRTACYLLNLGLRDKQRVEKVYKLIRDNVRENAVNLQSKHPYHIDDTHVAHAIGDALETILERSVLIERKDIRSQHMQSLDSQIMKAEEKVGVESGRIVLGKTVDSVR